KGACGQPLSFDVDPDCAVSPWLRQRAASGGAATGAGARCAWRHAMATASASIEAEIRYGSPGSRSGDSSDTTQPKLPAYTAGPTMPASATRLISAPWVRPCRCGSTWRVISACDAGLAAPQIAAIGSPSRNSQPCGASPDTVK